MTHEHHDHVVDRVHDHGHVYDQSHGSSVWARVRHAVSELVGGHSHDAADQIDDALEADAAGRRALLISLLGLAVTAAIQASSWCCPGRSRCSATRCTTSPTR